MQSVLKILCLHILISSVGAFSGHLVLTCSFRENKVHSNAARVKFIFNKELVLECDADEEKCVGFTKMGETAADILNRNSVFLKKAKIFHEICKYVPELYKTMKTTVEPRAWIHLDKADDGKHPTMLVCSVAHFYPKQITVRWLRNGENVTTGVSNTDVMANGNWLYQIHSYLEYIPKYTDTITCVVDHESLEQPMFKVWEPITEPMKIKLAIGSFGLLVGLGVFFAGLTYYKKKPGRILVPSTPQ